MAKDDLTDKQQKFAAAYEGNAKAAAIAAGYSEKSAEKLGRDLLQIPKVADAIRERQEKAIRPLIATREDRQRFWTETMKDEGAKMPDRLKASELLGKSDGDFLDRVEHSGGIAGRKATPAEAAEAMKRRIAQNKSKYEAQ